jgi:hypothetical protein
MFALPDYVRSNGLQRETLSLVSTTEELLGRQSSDSGLEIWEYGGSDPSRWQRGTLYPQKLALTWCTQAKELVFIFLYIALILNLTTVTPRKYQNANIITDTLYPQEVYPRK